MVIIKTSATEVKTQAVSPELTVHFSTTAAEQLGGAAGAAGAAAAAAGAAGVSAGAAAGAAGAAGARGRRIVLRHRGGRGEANKHGRRQRQRWSEAGQ